MPIRFAHISDCHLGSWNNHPELKEMSILAFEKAMEECIQEKVDFILVAGDLFDTALPPVDILKRAVTKLKKASDHGLRVYAIAGSHDFSPTGKTMLNVLEEAGLLVYVAKHTEKDGKLILQVFEDPSGAKICGIVGKKGSLDMESFGMIDKEIESIQGFKIFMFHSAVAEFRPKNMEDMPAVSIKELPKNFDYYATGHVHVLHTSPLGKGYLVFPNALFPTEFPELEKYDSGFTMAEVHDGKITLSRKAVKLFDVVSLHFSAEGKTPGVLQREILSAIEKQDLRGKALLLKLSGILASGKPTDIDMKAIMNLAQERGAFTIKKNTAGLSSSEFEEIRILENMSTDEIERKIILEHADHLKLAGEKNPIDLVLSLMNILKEEKGEDETNASFETRLKENAKKVLVL